MSIDHIILLINLFLYIGDNKVLLSPIVSSVNYIDYFVV